MTDRRIDHPISEFYEDDESPKDVAAAFERGSHGVTGRPIPWPLTLTESSETEAAIGDRRVSILTSFPHVPQLASQGNTTGASKRPA